ncbi:MAG: hypothetical protein HZB33_03235 [Nitrospirae bacterium]|nr:hypothetical protein [Nitrospirota bacterium]
MEDPELIANLRGKVEKYLREMEVTYEATKDSYEIRYGSTAVLLWPDQTDDNETILSIKGLVLSDVKKTGNEAMFEEFNGLNEYYYFAKIYWLPYTDNPDEGNIWAVCNLLGENLDFDEFRRVLVHVTNVADDLDDELQAKYGGEKYTD